MRRGWPVVVAVSVATLAPSSGQPPAVPPPASPKAVVGRAFVVAPVTTELQRRLLNGTESSRAVVFVDVAALFRDRRDIDLDALEFDPLRSALTKYNPEKGRSVAHAVFHHAPGPRLPAKGIELIELATDSVCKYAGFVPAVPQTVEHNVPFTFGDFAAPLRDATGTDAAEPAVGDERAKAYPVRTPLSRVLTGSAAGFVDVRTRLDGTSDSLPADVNESVRSAVRALRLPRGGRVDFNFRLGERDEKTSDRFRGFVRDWTEPDGLSPGFMRF